jgi:hypothetical protein
MNADELRYKEEKKKQSQSNQEFRKAGKNHPFLKNYAFSLLPAFLLKGRSLS